MAAVPGWETVGDSSFDVEEWKARALAAEQELEEHQETSAELEAELEKELAEKEEQLKVWQSKYQQLDAELGGANERQALRLREATQTVEKLERVNQKLEETTKNQSQLIRKLEQNVDDLERDERESQATISTLETRLNEQTERAIVLESERLEDKDRLEQENQRLRDAYRDLEQDLSVLRINNQRLLASASTRCRAPTTQCRSPSVSAPQSPVNNSPTIQNAVFTYTSSGHRSEVHGRRRGSPVAAGPLRHSKIRGHESPANTSGSSTNSNTSENSVNAAITPKRHDVDRTLVYRNRKHKKCLKHSKSGDSTVTPESPALAKSYTVDFRATPSTPKGLRKSLLYNKSDLPSSVESPRKKTPFLKRVFGLGKHKSSRREKHGSGVSTDFSTSTVREADSEISHECFHTPALRIEDFREASTR